jgi:hypothetical protein
MLVTWAIFVASSVQASAPAKVRGLPPATVVIAKGARASASEWKDTRATQRREITRLEDGQKVLLRIRDFE